MRVRDVLLLTVGAMVIIAIMTHLVVASWQTPPAPSASLFPHPTLTTSPAVPAAPGALNRPIALEQLAPDLLAHGHCLWLGDNWIACKVER